MEFPKPQKNKFTVYSKSGCVNCTKVKNILKENSFTFSVIDCDEFILENKEEFLLFIKKIIGKEHRIFPMVFDNEKFIGGFNETSHYVKDLLELDVFF